MAWSQPTLSYDDQVLWYAIYGWTTMHETNILKGDIQLQRKILYTKDLHAYFKIFVKQMYNTE